MKAEHSRFLNRLRESGATNMWGASPYLEDTFGVDHVTAVDILVEWMDSFSSGGVNDPEAERVLRILDEYHRTLGRVERYQQDLVFMIKVLPEDTDAQRQYKRNVTDSNRGDLERAKSHLDGYAKVHAEDIRRAARIRRARRLSA